MIFQVTADISYNGYNLNEFNPHKTSAYISQYDRHISELTVRETLDFAARCQGVGDRAGKIFFRSCNPQALSILWLHLSFLDRMGEVTRRERQAGIVPEPDIDTYMKVKPLHE